METLKKLHFMGVGGAGLSAVCLLSKQAGFEISSCDLEDDSPFLDGIKRANISFSQGHSSDHIKDIDALVVSPAIESLDPNNKEVFTALQKNLPVFIGEEFLAKYLIGAKRLIAVSGTHGKSTTTAMIGYILEKSGLDPTVLIGAISLDWGTNLRIGEGKYFVLEADEYKEKFLLYRPFIEVITSIEMDHPEYYENKQEVKEAFEKFISNLDENGKVFLGRNVSIKSNNSQEFKKREFDLKLIGDFNQENASIAFQVSKFLGIEDKVIEESLRKFSGLSRRFEFKGEESGIKVFDDYGHHPSAIKATLEATKKKFPDSRIWFLYQPHMFTRTAYLFDDFVEVFKNSFADFTILVDIFAARQSNKEGISSLDIVKKVNKDSVKYIGDFGNTAYYIAKNANVGDVVLVMGAGDIYKLSPLILRKLKNRS